MMYAYRTPGVRFEWLDPPAGISERRTDIAGFVGIAARGPLNEPVKIESWTQFVATFGGHIPQAYLAYAVEGFFANGARTCWVVRVGDESTSQRASIELNDEAGARRLRLTAGSPGAWGNDVSVSVVPTAEDRFTLSLSMEDGGSELWRNLTLQPEDERNAVDLLGGLGAYRESESPEAKATRIASLQREPGPGRPDVVRRRAGRFGSDVVHAFEPSPHARVKEAAKAQVPNLRATTARLQGGSDSFGRLTPEHFSGKRQGGDERWGLSALDLIDEVSIVAVPDLMPKPRVVARPVVRERRCDVIEEAEPPVPAAEREHPVEFPRAFSEQELENVRLAIIQHCERLGDRVAVLDPRIGDTTPARVAEWRAGIDTSYATLNWPWVRCPDPLRLDGLLRAVPPSGHVAGIYARSDLRVGVHRAPANELLEGVADLVAPADDAVHGDLNQQGINVIRVWNGQGLRLAGARTLSRDPVWRYLNVRRLLNMLKEGLLEDMSWIVFEPNGPETWRRIARTVRGFLDRLWRQGMLDGATADDAYFVVCDETTNPPSEVDAGRLTCLIGIQPPWPAEFVIVRIGRTADTVQILETSRARYV